MEDSLSSSYNSKHKKKKQHPSFVKDSSRGGPEGDSLDLLHQPLKPSTSTPAAASYKKKNKKKSRSNIDSSDTEESRLPSPAAKKVSKRKIAANKFQDGDGDSFGSMDSKRSRLSSEGASAEDTSGMVRKKAKAKKSAPPQTDLSWEMAVEKARGMPDGAMGSEDDSDEMDEDEIDVDAPPPEEKKAKKTPKKEEKSKSKSLNVIQTAAKKLKKITSKTSEGDSANKKAAKRESEEDLNNAEKKKTKEEQTKKEKKLQRKSTKGTYSIAVEAKVLWEQLRRFDLPHEKRHEISTALYTLVKGKARELIFAHDTSRVIQCMMKYCSQEHKNAIFEELREHIVDMTKSKYAKFFIRKLLKYGTKAQRNYVFRKLYGNVRKLITHKEAAAIIECAYNDYANAVQRHALIEEFYGPSFALFKTHELKNLEQIIQSKPEKRDLILSNMNEVLNALVDKSILQYSIVHRVFLDFFTIATDSLRAEMIQTVREGIVHMLHTRDGARVAMTCLWYGTTKDRKIIVKSFKTFVAKICKEEYGHMVMLALFDSVDDTKLVMKAMLEEMFKSVHELATDQYGRKVLLYLVSPRDPAHFHPDIINILKQGDGNQYSKKDADVRRRELLEFSSRPLIQYIKDHCKDLVMNNSTLILVLAIITHAKADPTDAMRAISELAAEKFVAGSLENLHIVEHPAGTITLKKLILNDATRIKKGESALFSGILLDILPEGCLKSWAACNRGCFILIHLLELKHQEVTEKVHKEILPITASLKKMNFKGAQTLLNKL